MRIGIDARMFGASENKGLGRYLEKIITNLELVDQKNEYYIFLRKKNWDSCEPQNPRFHKILANCYWYGFCEQLLMPIKIWRQKINLMHFPHFNVPIFYFGKFIVTIHDLIIFDFDRKRASTLGPLVYYIKKIFLRLVVWSATKRAHRIITVSNFSKKEILQRYKINPGKIEVIYGGVGKIKKRKQVNNLEIMPHRYFLYVGSAFPHKNLKILISAWNKFREKNSGYKLILVGQLDYFYKNLKQSFSEIPSDKLIFAGEVSDKKLRELYQRADLYIFPSLKEGFGLPGLEAMSYGVPVLASNNSCLPEIFGDAAIYFDPNNESDILKSIKMAIDNPKVCSELRDHGYQRIQKYNWYESAGKTLKIYEN